MFYASAKNFSEASKLLSKAITLDPNSIELYLFRAEALNSQRKFPEAIADCNKASKLEPGNKKAIMVMGEIKAAQEGQPFR